MTPANRDRIDELHQALLERVGELTTGEQWLAWLRTARQFHRYSPSNQLLLALQGASGQVASYRTWQRIPDIDGGTCQVRKGERGLTILAPLRITERELDEAGDDITVERGLRGFKPVTVFHQGQLVVAPALAAAPLPQLLTGENRWQHVWSAAVAHIAELGYDVSLHARSPIDTWNGRTSFADRHVLVADTLEPAHQLKTLLHEWAHITLGHAEPGRRRDLMEVEAESVAYLACATIGLDSSAYSVPYVAGWSGGDATLIETTSTRVLAATTAMVSAIEQRLSIELTPDLITLSGPAAAAVVVVALPSTEPPAHPGPHTVTLNEAATPASSGQPLGARFLQLDEPDRRRLVGALDQLDTDVAAAAQLCVDAGLDAPAVRAFLVSQGAQLDAVDAAITDLAADITDITVTARRRPGPAALARLQPEDREILEVADMSRREVVAVSANLLPRGEAITARDAVDVLRFYGAVDVDIDYAMRCAYYDPATRRVAPYWTSAAVDAALDPTAGPHDELIRQVAEHSGSPDQVAALTVGLGFDADETRAVCRRVGLDVDFVDEISHARDHTERATPAPGAPTVAADPPSTGTRPPSSPEPSGTESAEVATARDILAGWDTPTPAPLLEPSPRWPTSSTRCAGISSGGPVTSATCSTKRSPNGSTSKPRQRGSAGRPSTRPVTGWVRRWCSSLSPCRSSDSMTGPG